MNKSLERTLQNIIPTANSIPRELLDTANSLLSQSRNRIGGLNGEEETARETVCAHIACERMKLKLNLPKIEPRPPVRPKIYNKLYAHFESVLSSGSAQSTSSSSTKTRPNAVTGAAAVTTATTPSKRRQGALAQFVPTSKRTERRPSDDHAAEIQDLCMTCGCPEAAEHVSRAFDALSSSFKYSPLASHPPTLIGALFMVISVRMRGDEERDAAESTERYRKLRDQVFDAMGEGLTGMTKNRFDGFVAGELMHEDITEMAWYQDIPEGDAGEDMEVDHTAAAANTAAATTMVIVGKEPVLKKKKTEAAGVGTMMQERVDFLSERRRKNYADWKVNIMKRIESLV